MHSYYVLNVVMLHTCKREMFAFLAILATNVSTDMPTCIQRYLRAFVSIRILTAMYFLSVMSFLRLCGVASCLSFTVIATDHGHLHSPLHSRASSDRPDGSFVVERQRNANHIRNGAMAKAKVMRKYSQPEDAGSYFRDIGQRQMQRLAKRQQDQTGEVQATPEEYYSEYLVPVSIGGQTLMIDMGKRGTRCLN